MKTRHSCPARSLVLAALLALGASGSMDLAHAGERNVFGPDTGADPAPATNTSLDSLELRGVMSIGDTTRVTLFDTASSKSYTVELNEEKNNWRVSGYSADDDTVTVESGGQTRRITLRKPKILAVAAAPTPVAMPVPGQPPPNFQPAMGQPQPMAIPATGTPVPQMSDEEVRKRMENVAAEIQRRRQMRREQIERVQPGQAPQRQ